ECLEDTYGDDWAAERLPLCGCKKLLGKRLDDDEIILDQADYAHYAEIMTHEEHFELIFSKGFECPEKLAWMIRRLGQLRARANHARMFTSDDWSELTRLWRLVSAGLADLGDDVVFEYE